MTNERFSEIEAERSRLVYADRAAMTIAEAFASMHSPSADAYMAALSETERREYSELMRAEIDRQMAAEYELEY